MARIETEVPIITTTVRIPEILHRTAGTYAALIGWSLNDLLTEALTKYLASDPRSEVVERLVRESFQPDRSQGPC